MVQNAATQTVGSYTQLLQAALSRAHHGLNMADRPVNRGVGLVQERKHAALGDAESPQLVYRTLPEKLTNQTSVRYNKTER